jgi:hypothetical protein
MNLEQLQSIKWRQLNFLFPILRASSILSEMRHKKLGARICNLLENKTLRTLGLSIKAQLRTFRLVA